MAYIILYCTLFLSKNGENDHICFAAMLYFYVHTESVSCGVPYLDLCVSLFIAGSINYRAG